MKSAADILKDLPYPLYLTGISALEHYSGLQTSGIVHLYTTASLIEMAREFEDVTFPACDFADILLRIPRPSSGIGENEEVEVAVSCNDYSPESPAFPRPGIGVCSFIYDIQSRCYKDIGSTYRELRKKTLETVSIDSVSDVIDAALLVGRLGFKIEKELRKTIFSRLEEYNSASYWHDISPLYQRYILMTLLGGPSPQAGLSILKKSGFIEHLWPELSGLSETVHAKEFHPEGDVWDHTMEVFKYRKTRDIRLSLGLLLHDIGKPLARKESGNAFNRHAQIGASLADQFLRRLGFDVDIRSDVHFLVVNHMLPPFISRLPVFRTEKVMSSPLFPLLLELYRCDLSSTFRSPEDYYTACKAYRKFLKNRRNPFRSAQGKKLLRMYVE